MQVYMIVLVQAGLLNMDEAFTFNHVLIAAEPHLLEHHGPFNVHVHVHVGGCVS